MATDPITEALAPYSACDVSDALLKLKVPRGGFLPGITMFSPERQAGATKIVGPAYTVQYALLSDPAPKVAAHYIDGVPAGAVVFLSSPRGVPNAVFGGLMATRAQVQGAAGTVVDGRLRDLLEHRALGYAVFARATGTTAPAEVAKVVGVNVALEVAVGEGEGGSEGASAATATVAPGDYIVADADGVVVLPRALAAQALPLMAKQVAADEQVAAALKAGMSFTEASKKFRGA